MYLCLYGAISVSLGFSLKGRMIVMCIVVVCVSDSVCARVIGCFVCVCRWGENEFDFVRDSKCCCRCVCVR